jgi:predicted transcriptional regulator
MAKRGRLEIIKDILTILQNNRGAMLPTPLLRRSNLSTTRFKEYFMEMKKKGFVEVGVEDKMVLITERGRRFLEKYKTIVNFVDEFGL